MVKGDKLRCKKSKECIHSSEIVLSFTEGKNYEIMYVDNGIVYFFDNYGYKVYFHSGDIIYNNSLWNYFYSKKELRKLKIDNICKR